MFDLLEPANSPVLAQLHLYDLKSKVDSLNINQQGEHWRDEDMYPGAQGEEGAAGDEGAPGERVSVSSCTFKVRER